MSASKGLTNAAIAIGIIAIVLGGLALATNYVPGLKSPAGYQPRTRNILIIMGEGEIIGENETGHEVIIGEFHRWEPNTITVFKGDTLNITVQNPRSHAHSFVLTVDGTVVANTGRIPGRDDPVLGPNVPLSQRTKVITPFVVDKAGVFQWECGVAFNEATHETTGDCDPDHRRMVGNLIVLEP